MKPDAHFPGILGEIRKVAGEAAARAIARDYGGCRVHFPAHASEGLWLVECVGEGAAAVLCDHFRTHGASAHGAGVRHVYVPLGPESLRNAAQRLALTALQQGTSVNEAAKVARVHARTIFRWRQKFKKSGLLK